MKTIVKSCGLVLLALVIAAPLSADDKKPAKEGAKKAAAKEGAKKDAAKKDAPKRRGGNQLLAATLKRLAKAELSEEQVASIKKLGAEHLAKIAEATKKGRLSKEQQQARAAARKKGQADGLKGKELQAAVNAAAELTDEQKAALAAAGEARAAFNKAVTGLLTAEQRKSLRGGARKSDAPKKKPAKDAAK